EFMPEPIADHAEPSQRAMRLAALPPALLNEPPATRSPPGMTARENTTLLSPAPSGDQAAPFQRAMRFAGEPPAAVKTPAAIRPPLGIAARARTSPFVPVPTGDQAAPSHCATLAASAVPAMVKEPPTTSRAGAGPGPSGSHWTMEWTEPLMPGIPSPGSHA